MRKGIMFILGIALVVLVQPLFAATEATCWEGDCLKFGWTQGDTYTGSFSEFQCYREGCDINGWIVGGSQGLSYYTQCKSGGCFTSGWYELDRKSHTKSAEVVCHKNDCLTKGYDIFNSDGSRYVVTCNENDCRQKGWKITQQGMIRLDLVCKKGGCFQQGWYSYP